jgi:hypothetical protein
MTRYNDDKSDEDVENDIFGFLEFLVITTRDQYEPTCIDDEYDSDECEKSIEIGYHLADDIDRSSEILFFEYTGPDLEYPLDRTVRRSVDRPYYDFRELDQEKSKERIDNSIIGFFVFLLLSCTRYSSIECIDHHKEKSEWREHLEYPNDREEYLPPERECQHTPDDCTIWYEECPPDRECDLHDKYPYRYPDDVLSPDFDFLFARIREEELHHTDDEKYDSNDDEEVLELECDRDKNSLQTIRTDLCREKEIVDRTDKSIENRVSWTITSTNGDIAEIDRISGI